MIWDAPRRSNSFGNNSQMPDEAAAFKSTVEATLRTAEQRVQELTGRQKAKELVR